MSDSVLEVRELSMAFGGLRIFDGIALDLHRGERHAVIGPNGAGKSTFVNVVTGLLRPTRGKLRLDGVDLTPMPAAQRVHAGLVRTFQINTLFQAMNPVESVVLALCERDGLARPSWRPIKRMTAQIDEAANLLERF